MKECGRNVYWCRVLNLEVNVFNITNESSILRNVRLLDFFMSRVSTLDTRTSSCVHVAFGSSGSSKLITADILSGDRLAPPVLRFRAARLRCLRTGLPLRLLLLRWRYLRSSNTCGAIPLMTSRDVGLKLAIAAARVAWSWISAMVECGTVLCCGGGG